MGSEKIRINFDNFFFKFPLATTTRTTYTLWHSRYWFINSGSTVYQQSAIPILPQPTHFTPQQTIPFYLPDSISRKSLPSLQAQYPLYSTQVQIWLPNFLQSWTIHHLFSLVWFGMRERIHFIHCQQYFIRRLDNRWLHSALLLRSIWSQENPLPFSLHNNHSCCVEFFSWTYLGLHT